MKASKGAVAAPPILAVVLDHAHARFFEVTDSTARELPGLQSPRMRGGKFHSDRQGSPGWGERGFHQRRREEERRHYAAVARRLQQLDRGRRARGVVVAGPGRIANAFRRQLPAAIAERVVSTARLNPTEVSPATVFRASRGAQRARRLAREQQLVAAVVEGLGTGMAVDGLPAVLAALGRGQVRCLLVARGFARPGYRCGVTGRLTAARADCRDEGNATREGDVVVAAAAAAVAAGAEVVTVEDSRLAARFDGIAALLRYGLA